MSEATVSSEATGNVSTQLAILVPTFDPAKDDLQVFTQKVELLLKAWPSNKLSELATRLILNCSGSAFKKLQLHQSEVTQNDEKSIKRIIELEAIGAKSHWSKSTSLPREHYTGASNGQMRVQTHTWPAQTSCGPNFTIRP